MSNQTEVSNRLPSLTQQANLQAQRNQKVQSLRQSVNSSTNENQNQIKPSKRNSLSSTVDHYSQNMMQQNVKLENTYSLGPNDNQKFNSSRVQRLVNDILSNHLENVKYEPNKCKEMVSLLSDEIKTRVKSIIYKRYKVIVNLTIGQNIGNGIIIASRALWNTDTDNGCTIQYKNSSLFACAAIYACYFD